MAEEQQEHRLHEGPQADFRVEAVRKEDAAVLRDADSLPIVRPFERVDFGEPFPDQAHGFQQGGGVHFVHFFRQVIHGRILQDPALQAMPEPELCFPAYHHTKIRIFCGSSLKKVCKPCRKSDIARLAIVPSFLFPFPNFAKKRKRL